MSLGVPSCIPRALAPLCVGLLALVLNACGGGGAASPPLVSIGPLAIAPASATFYAGVPYELVIAGGRGPYLVSSSEPTVIALNRLVSGNTFTIVPNNPGVIDPGVGDTEVPRRTVTISVRDSLGATVSSQYSVLQNFLTGYRQVYANTCPGEASVASLDACAGTDSLVQLVPVSQGILYANRELRLDRVRGDYLFVNEDLAVIPQEAERIFVRTDGTGRAFARIRVSPAAQSQLATYTVTDVASGASTTVAFLIVGVSTTVPDLEIIPQGPITFVGRNEVICGGGETDVFVVGGRPPYTVSAPSSLGLAPSSTLLSSSSRLTISLQDSPVPCPPAYTVLVTDSRGETASLTINSVVGTAGPEAPPVEIAPGSLPGSAPALKCGQSASVAVIGGRSGASRTIRSTHQRVNGTITGSTLRVERVIGDGATVYPDSFTVTVTDGLTTATLSGSTATNCP